MDEFEGKIEENWVDVIVYSSRNIEKERLLEVQNYFYAMNVTTSLAFSDVPDGV